MNSDSRIVSQQDIDAYRRDGVVLLQRAFDASWLDLLRQGIAKNMKTPSPRFAARTSAGSTARYCEDYWVWSSIAEFESFVRRSPAASLGAALMAARRINLVMDNWFLREPGTAARAPWHHDISYFDFDGTMCVLWLPLERSRRGEGVEFVRGSHLWNRLFMRVMFKDHQQAAESAWVRGKVYEDAPDIDARREHYDIVSFDLEPGDCLVFDIRTLHGSTAEHLPDKLQTRYTLRLAAEDARIEYRGTWAMAEREEFERFGHRDGDELNSDFFPQLWPAATGDRPA